MTERQNERLSHNNTSLEIFFNIRNCTTVCGQWACRTSCCNHRQLQHGAYSGAEHDN